jgi:hypothetical protein
MRAKTLTILIPVRSESEALPHTLQELEKSVKTPHFILVVDDHVDAKDKTPQTVKKLLSKYKTLLWLPKTPTDPDGFGPALCRGIETIQTPLTVIVMGDGCDDPKAIDTMVKRIQHTRIDVVAGSRYMKGGRKIGGPLLQHVCSLLLNKFLHFIGLPLTDATNAFKLYKTSFLHSILPQKPLPGVEFSLQLAIEGYQKQAKYIDIPTTWHGRAKGASKLRLLKNGRRYIKLAWKLITS